MARYFLSGASTSQKRFSRAAVECLETYNWPGNVRELVNAVQRAALLSRTELILPEHFPPALRRPVKPSPATASSLQDTEKDTILCALRETNGNRTHAAGLLGITRRGLIYKLKRLGLDGKS
jgi:DNA-binding NtrC family response regulator